MPFDIPLFIFIFIVCEQECSLRPLKLELGTSSYEQGLVAASAQLELRTGSYEQGLVAASAQIRAEDQQLREPYQPRYQ